MASRQGRSLTQATDREPDEGRPERDRPDSIEEIQQIAQDVLDEPDRERDRMMRDVFEHAGERHVQHS